MLTAVLERRLKAVEPDLDSARETCVLLGSVARTAASASIDLMTWIQPKALATLKFNAGLLECLGLLSTELRFKGFAIVNEVPAIDVELSSAALRSVLCAALLTLSDLSKAPANLIIRALALPDRVELTIDLRSTESHTPTLPSEGYRPLSWRDVEILAMAESVKLTHASESAQLTFPLQGASLTVDEIIEGAIIAN